MYCECCEKFVDYLNYCNWSNHVVCPTCIDTLNKVHSHSYKPQIEFKGRSNLYFGIELELQGFFLADIFKFIQSIDDKYFYLKHDGSLNNYGVEIVSMPMSIELIKGKSFKKLFRDINRYDITNTENCGLHFHLDRKYFTPITLAKLDMLTNTYNEDISKVCGRNYWQNSRFCKTILKPDNSWGRSCYDRYVACNLENEKTIELRFCKATADYDKFIERVNLIVNIIDIVNQYSMTDLYSGDKYHDIAQKLLNVKG